LKRETVEEAERGWSYEERLILGREGSGKKAEFKEGGK